MFYLTPMPTQSISFNFVAGTPTSELMIYPKDFFRKRFPSASKNMVPASVTMKTDTNEKFDDQCVLFSENLANIMHRQQIEIIPNPENSTLTLLSSNMHQSMTDLMASKEPGILKKQQQDFEGWFGLMEYPLKRLNKNIFNFWKYL